MTNIAQTNTYPFTNVTLATPLSNVTGDGTTYTIILDTQGSGSGYNVSTGVFTAPQSMYYSFTYLFEVTGLASAHTLCVLNLVATYGTFQLQTLSTGTGRNNSNIFGLKGNCSVKMTSGDTASFTVQISNSTKVCGLGANSYLNVQGFL